MSESVEDLLRSLRATVEKRQANSERNDIFELKNPIKSSFDNRSTNNNDSLYTDSAGAFVGLAIQKAVERYLTNSNEIRNIIENYLVSDRFEEILIRECAKNFEQNNNFENTVRETIEQKISKLLK
jgi:hypothetical protein